MRPHHQLPAAAAPAFLQLFAMVAMLALGEAGANAEDAYPAKPVRIVVSFSAGGPTDTVARIMGAKMGDLLGQQFLVENKVGAGGNIGADLVAKAAPDGYTLMVSASVQWRRCPRTPSTLGSTRRFPTIRFATLLRLVRSG